MKLRKALKITLLTQSLLWSSLPVQAQPLRRSEDAHEETHTDSQKSTSDYTSSYWYNRVNGALSYVGSYFGYSKDELTLDSMSTGFSDFGMSARSYNLRTDLNSDDRASFCGGRFQEIELPGISGLVERVDEMCSASKVPEFFDNVKERGLIGFCGYISQKVGQGGCYSKLVSGDGLDHLEDKILRDPELRKKFIEREKEVIKKQRDKMLKVSSLQSVMSQDVPTLTQVKDVLRHHLLSGKSNFANSLRSIFKFNDSQIEAIKKGTISLKTISEKAFQCTPDDSFYTTSSPLDTSILGQCGEDGSDQNKIVRKAYDAARGTDSNYVGLLKGQDSQVRGLISRGINKEYKGLIDSNGVTDRRHPSNTNSEVYAKNFVHDTREVLGVLDSYGKDTVSNLYKEIRNKLTARNPDYARIKRETSSMSLDLTLKGLEKKWNGDDTNSKIIETIKNNYVVEKDGLKTLDFKEGGIKGALDTIKEKLGPEYAKNGRDALVKNSLRQVLAGSMLGPRISLSSSLHWRVESRFDDNNSPLNTRDVKSLLPGLANAAGAPGAPAMNPLMNPFLSVFRSLRNHGRGNKSADDDEKGDDELILGAIEDYFSKDRNPDDVTFDDFVKGLNQANGESCSTGRVNAATLNYNIVKAMAVECNKLKTPQAKGDIDSRYCPTMTNPIVAELLVEDTMKHPENFAGNNPGRAMSALYSACFPITLQTVYYNSSNDKQQGDQDKSLVPSQQQASGPNLPGACQLMKNAEMVGVNNFGSRLANFQRECLNQKEAMAKQALNTSYDSPIGGSTNFSAPADLDRNRDFSGMLKGFGGYSSASRSTLRSNDASSLQTIASDGKYETMPNDPSAMADFNANQNMKNIASKNVGSGINSNIFDTKKAVVPNRNFYSTIKNNDAAKNGANEINSDALKSQLSDNNGAVSPDIQKILDRMAAMEKREKALVSKQSELLAKINNPKSDVKKNAAESETAKQLAAVTKELSDLKKKIPELVAKAKAKDKEQNKPKVTSTPRPYSPSNYSSSARSSSGSLTNNANSSGASSFGNQGASGNSVAVGGAGQGASAGGSAAINSVPVGPVALNRVNAPAYTQSRTFVLTQSIRDKADIVPAGVSIEDAVLRSKRPILIPYGNGEYMYVEPQINASGEVETRDGHVVYKEVLKVSDSEAVARAKVSKDKSRKPASIEEIDPNEKIYDWDVFSRQLDEAQK